MADQGIDPRYAAQFQRGFDPARHPVVVTPAAAPSVREAPVRLPGGPEASAPRVDEVRAPVHVPDQPAVPAVEPPVERPAEPPAVDETGSRAVVLEWALLGVGILLLLAAAAMFWQAATDPRLYTGTTDVAQQTYVLVRNTLPGPLLVAGVAAISVWIVLRAIATRR